MKAIMICSVWIPKTTTTTTKHSDIEVFHVTFHLLGHYSVLFINFEKIFEILK